MHVSDTPRLGLTCRTAAASIDHILMKDEMASTLLIFFLQFPLQLNPRPAYWLTLAIHGSDELLPPFHRAMALLDLVSVVITATPGARNSCSCSGMWHVHVVASSGLLRS